MNQDRLSLGELATRKRAIRRWKSIREAREELQREESFKEMLSTLQHQRMYVIPE